MNMDEFGKRCTSIRLQRGRADLAHRQAEIKRPFQWKWERLPLLLG